MAGIVRILGCTAALLVLGSPSYPQHGSRPRPAEKPPEYGCRILDLATSPNTVPDGGRIAEFLLKYRCEEKTRPVDFEIHNERVPGADLELVKVSTDVTLEKGEHTIRLTGGGVANGGRYITMLKARVPEGKKEIMRRVDTAFCKGWELEYVEKRLHVGGCDISLRTDPRVFQTGERIDAFLLNTNCDFRRQNADIRISWEPVNGGQPQIVKVATDVNIPAGKHDVKLGGGGVGKAGHYLLQIQGITDRSTFKTSCTAWTMKER